MTETEQHTDDIALCAYIDGELPESEASELQARLLQEPELARRLELLRGSDSDAQRLYAEIDERPMPQAVLDLLQQKPAAAREDNVIAFPARGVRQFLQMPVAIAASVALLAGFLVADMFRATDDASPEVSSLYAGQIDAQSNLHRLLEEGTSNDAQVLAEGVSAELLLTFQDRNGDFCRQLRVDGGVAPLQGLACRRGDSWQVEAVSIAAEPAPDGNYQLASGATPIAIDAAIDALIGPRPPLDKDEERSIISNTWKKTEN